jgi:hypothetical protein
MSNITLSLTLEEAQELHVTLLVRVGELREAVHADNKPFAEASLRQLERTRPLLYYIESVLREHHTAKA